MKRMLVFLATLLLTYTSYAVEKPMAIIIPSYNNIEWYEKNLSSIFSQN